MVTECTTSSTTTDNGDLTEESVNIQLPQTYGISVTGHEDIRGIGTDDQVEFDWTLPTMETVTIQSQFLFLTTCLMDGRLHLRRVLSLSLTVI